MYIYIHIYVYLYTYTQRVRVRPPCDSFTLVRAFSHCECARPWVVCTLGFG